MAKAALTVDFWDVGQADCSVIELSNGSFVIIDVGTRTSPLVDYLHDHSNQIQAIVLTHNHFDHAGAMPVLVHEFKRRIDNVFMLLDGDPNNEKFQRIFRPVAEANKAGFFNVETLDRGREIAVDGTIDLKIEALYPSFVQGVLARGQNKHSGIVRLSIRNETKVIWPGDIALDDLYETCDKLKPLVLVGPNHGAPAKFENAYAPAWMGSVGPRRAFISVGTNNQPSHPRPRYLHMLRDNNCKVICSQLTNCCDRVAVAQGKAIFPSHGLLGLPSPRKGVSCRGAFRLEFDGHELQPDRWDNEHLARISQLRHPQCLAKRGEAGEIKRHRN